MDFGSEQWMTGLATLIESQGSDQFWPRLYQQINLVAPLNSMIITAFTGTDCPKTLFDNLEKDQFSVYITLYDEGAYLLDPFFLACREGIAEGVYRLKDLAPDHFRRSEYYRTYYKLTGITEELGFLIPLGGERHIFVSLERAHGQWVFSRIQVANMRKALPVLGRLIIRHVEKIDLVPMPTNNNDIFDYIDVFGHSDLTKRERQVARLILRGHSSHSIAQNLDISYDTVKNHRKKLFSKLKISSQTELFQRFMASLPLIER